MTETVDSRQQKAGDDAATRGCGNTAIAQVETWSAEQLAMFPDLRFESMTDEQLGLFPDLPDVPERPLTPQERVYVQLYCSNGMKGTAAARGAGYAHAHVASSRLLKRVRIQKAIAIELGALLEDGRVSREALLLKLAAMAHGDLGALIRELPNPDCISLSDLKELPPEITAAIKKLKVRTSETTSRLGIDETESTVDIELHDPKGAMELISKILKYSSDQVDLTSGGKALAGGATVIYMPAERRDSDDAADEVGQDE